MNPYAPQSEPTEVVQYVRAGHFVTFLLPEVRDFDEFAHEVQMVVTDLLGAASLWDLARIERHGGVAAVTAGRATTYTALTEALGRVADRWQVPAIFWAEGALQVAERREH